MSRFMDQAECQRVAARLGEFTSGGGTLDVNVESQWSGYTRWTQNAVDSAGDVRNNVLRLTRVIRGARSTGVEINQLDDAALHAAMRRAERLIWFDGEQPDPVPETEIPVTLAQPKIFSDATYQLEAEPRAAATRALVERCASAGMLAAGYVQVSAHGRALISNRGRALYYPYTQAQYSVTVRDPKGTGSGWAGQDHYDWSKIDGAALTERALDKCLRSRNPVAVEPGRYTAILEPQAVCDLLDLFFQAGEPTMDRITAETDFPSVMGTGHGRARFGERVFDERLTFSADPMDPLLGFAPFAYDGVQGGRGEEDPTYWLQVYRPVEWVKNGILQHLAYDTRYAVQQLGQDVGLPNSGAFHMQVTGPTQTIDEMIAGTERGLLVTRFSNIELLDLASHLLGGYTRDGVWLIERGKISKPVKNFRFTESPLFAFNKIDALGEPVRVFRPSAPAVCPPIKVHDFSFTALADAV